MRLGRLLSASIVAGAVLLSSVPFASADTLSIGIVDAPRPQPKWGYAPTKRQIPAGSWVTWSNNGQDAHTVTALDGTFDSGNLDPSEGFSWYFADPGTFDYVCALHPWMKGRIVVGDDVLPATDSPAAV